MRKFFIYIFISLFVSPITANSGSYSIDYVEEKVRKKELPAICVYMGPISRAKLGTQTRAKLKKWNRLREKYGADWEHMHHYCWALIDIQGNLYSQAIGNFDYVLSASKRSFKLRPLVLQKKAQLLLITPNKYFESIKTLNELITVSPRSEWGYIMLAQAYRNTGQNDAAEKIIKIGLKNIPKSKSLRKLKKNLK